MAIELIIAVALVAANGFFVASEFAIARLRPTQVADFLRERRPGARSAHHAVTHIDSYLSACQLGITLASLGLGAVGEPAFHQLLEPLLGDSAHIAGFGLASAVAFLVITVLHVVLGELAPKSAAISRTAPMALALAPPMRAFYLATKPFVDAFNGLGNLVLKPFGIPPASEAGHAPHSEDELRELLRESREGGLIERDEQQLSEAALVFGDRRAREVMTPRSEVSHVTAGEEPRKIAEKAMASGHTRLPVAEAGGGLESAVGFINAKDLLPVAFGGVDDGQRLRVRPLARVAESTRLDEVLREMRRDRRHLALVFDEHGTVVGLITLEDILEELVGEIEDEFDPREPEPIRADDGGVRIDGGAPLRLVAERLGMDVDAPHEATIGGYVTQRLGRVPDPDEVVEVDGVRFTVLDADDTRITALRA
ncbi:MAG TPA: hemolysin family protein [Actinomycetota bacterium]|nr:hemolysin family protein [Actinomycetota bacterium]